MIRKTATLNQNEPDTQDRVGQVQSIGEVLEELLRQYQVRFPSINVVVVETPAAAV